MSHTFRLALCLSANAASSSSASFWAFITANFSSCANKLWQQFALAWRVTVAFDTNCCLAVIACHRLAVAVVVAGSVSAAAAAAARHSNGRQPTNQRTSCLSVCQPTELS